MVVLGRGRWRKIREEAEDSGPLADVFREFKRRYGDSFETVEQAERAAEEFMVWWNTHKAKKS